MAKTKSKISSTQRDKSNILVAKKLKAAGIISKQAKLHGGKYISRGVLAKVREYEHQYHLDYRAVKVPKAVAQAAKERGYQVVQGNRIIGPNTQLFRNRIKAGAITGIKPVKGGFMEEVILPHNVFDMRTLVNQLETGMDTLKMPNEQFAFKYKGSESYRAFPNTQMLLEYLRHYRGAFDVAGHLKTEDLQEEFEALTFFRLHPNAIDVNIRNPQRRLKDKKRRMREAVERGEYIGQPNRKGTGYKNARAQKKDKAKSQKYRDALDRKAKEAYKEAARKRAQMSRERAKAAKKGK